MDKLQLPSPTAPPACGALKTACQQYDMRMGDDDGLGAPMEDEGSRLVSICMDGPTWAGISPFNDGNNQCWSALKDRP